YHGAAAPPGRTQIDKPNFVRKNPAVPRLLGAFFPIAVLVAVPALCAGEQSGTNQTLKALSIGDLATLDATTVAKHAETIGQAAAAISVVTSEDLRRAGITELAEA